MAEANPYFFAQGVICRVIVISSPEGNVVTKALSSPIILRFSATEALAQKRVRQTTLCINNLIMTLSPSYSYCLFD
jgi:hypothetical protein